MSDTLPLFGKLALVTGASRGIGAAIALRLGQEGADVAITYERSADKAEAVGREAALYDVRAQAKPARDLFAFSILYLMALFAFLLVDHWLLPWLPGAGAVTGGLDWQRVD